MPSALGTESPVYLISRACSSDAHTSPLENDGHHNHEQEAVCRTGRLTHPMAKVSKGLQLPISQQSKAEPSMWPAATTGLIFYLTSEGDQGPQKHTWPSPMLTSAFYAGISTETGLQ